MCSHSFKGTHSSELLKIPIDSRGLGGEVSRPSPEANYESRLNGIATTSKPLGSDKIAQEGARARLILFGDRVILAVCLFGRNQLGQGADQNVPNVSFQSGPDRLSSSRSNDEAC